LGRNNRSEDVVSEIISFALGDRFESIVRPDDPQNGFHTASTRNGHAGSAYSITSSARARIDGGMVSPSTFAIFWLIASSNSVGCSMGQFGRLRALEDLVDVAGCTPELS